MKVRGVPIASGLAMGAVALIADVLDWRGSGPPRDVETEEKRVDEAFAATRRDLAEAAARIEREVGSEVAELFRAHQLMLDGMRGPVTAEIRASGVDAAGAVRRVFRARKQKFESLRDPAFRQRADDVADLGRRLLRHLDGDGPYRLERVPEGAVVAAARLLPSDLVALSERRVAAILVESIGYASHAALLAREKSIPTVAIAGILEHVSEGVPVLVDAIGGDVVIGPDAATRSEFERRLLEHDERVARYCGSCQAAARTVDGVVVRVEANLGTRADVVVALANGADGVGLLRIEQLYLGREVPPTEDALYDEIREMAAPLRDKPLTVRLLDVGGDKPLPFLHAPAEPNPSLGLRGVRLLLRHPALLKTQLGAFVRLSREQEIRVLVPMVTLEEDVRATRRLFDETCAALRVASRPQFGAMVETPAAALAIPSIARHCDFLSVGTNDLTQYTFAAGRDDPNVDAYFQEAHDSLLRLLEIIVGDAGDVPITLCGELAGRDELLPRLLGMGFRSLSIAPPLIPATKERIRALRAAG